MPRPHALPERVGCPPGSVRAAPSRTGRLGGAPEQELEHEAVAVALVQGRLMPDVVVDDDEGAGITGELPHGDLVRPLGVILAARQDTGRPQLGRRVLRVVEQQRPAVAVKEVLRAVGVDAGRLPPRGVHVAVAVRVHGIAGPQDAGQRPGDVRVVQDSRDLRNARQQIVAGVALRSDHAIQRRVQLVMVGARQRGLQRDVALVDEVLHPGVVEQDRFCTFAHGADHYSSSGPVPASENPVRWSGAPSAASCRPARAAGRGSVACASRGA